MMGPRRSDVPVSAPSMPATARKVPERARRAERGGGGACKHRDFHDGWTGAFGRSLQRTRNVPKKPMKKGE